MNTTAPGLCAPGQHCVDVETRCCIHCDYVDPLDTCPECDALEAKLTEARAMATKWCKHALSRTRQLRAIRAQVDRLVAQFERDPSQGDITLPPDLQRDDLLTEVIRLNHTAWHVVKVHAQAIVHGTFDVGLQRLHMRAEAIVDAADAALKLAYDVGAVELIGAEEAPGDGSVGGASDTKGAAAMAIEDALDLLERRGKVIAHYGKRIDELWQAIEDVRTLVQQWCTRDESQHIDPDTNEPEPLPMRVGRARAGSDHAIEVQDILRKVQGDNHVWDCDLLGGGKGGA